MAQRAKTHRPPKAPGAIHSTKPSEQASTRARGIRATNRWRKLSEAKRRKNPLCEDPFGDHGGRVVAAESVHHVESVEARPDLAFVWENLMSVCNVCHNRLDKSKFKHLHRKPAAEAPSPLPRSSRRLTSRLESCVSRSERSHSPG